MDLSLPSRTLVRAAIVLAVVAGMLVSAQLASAASQRSTERAVRAKVVRMFGAYTRVKTIQVKCKRLSATRFGCYYLAPMPAKAKAKIILGNVAVRYRHNRPRMTFSRPTCLGSGCAKKKKG